MSIRWVFIELNNFLEYFEYKWHIERYGMFLSDIAKNKKIKQINFKPYHPHIQTNVGLGLCELPQSSHKLE